MRRPFFTADRDTAAIGPAAAGEAATTVQLALGLCVPYRPYYYGPFGVL